VTASESVMLSSTIRTESIIVSEYSTQTVTQEDKNRCIVRNDSKSIMCGWGFPFIYHGIFKRILTVELNRVKSILAIKQIPKYDLFY
jgi:hypothetical protein